MNSGTETRRLPFEGTPESEILAEVAPAAVPTLEPDDGFDAHRAHDVGLLAEVPYALDAYISRQCFGHC